MGLVSTRWWRSKSILLRNDLSLIDLNLNVQIITKVKSICRTGNYYAERCSVCRGRFEVKKDERATAEQESSNEAVWCPLTPEATAA
jgi:hypothetical protein